MCLRFALFAFLVLAASLRAADPTISIMSDDGKHPDLIKVNQFIDWAEPSIGKYPPHFKNADEQKRILAATRSVTDEIKLMNPDKFKDVDLVVALGYIMAMGHNVDMNSFTQARMFYDRALALSPNNAHANYLYGMLLVSTDQFHFDALPYLQKALQEGEREAQLPIAILYYQKGDQTSALEQLEKYSAWGPAVNPQVKALIRSMKDHTLEFKKPADSKDGK